MIDTTACAWVRVFVVVAGISLLQSARADVPVIRHEPVTRAEVEWLIAHLEMTDEESVIVRGLYASMHERYVEELLPDIARYNERAVEALMAINSESIGKGRRSRELVPPLMREYEELKGRYGEFTDSFRADLAGLLGEQRSEQIEPAFQAIERRRLLPNLTQLPEGKVDLIDLVRSLAVPVEVRERIETEFVPDFEPRLHAALKEVVRTMWQRLRDSWPVYDLQDQRKAATDAIEQSELIKQEVRLKERLSASRLSAAERMCNLNREALQRVSTLLPDEAAEELRTRFLELAYPEVYPDPADARLLFAALEHADVLLDEQRAAVESLRLTFITRHTALSEEMAEAIHWRLWSICGSRPSPIGTESDAWQALIDAGEAREKLNADQGPLLRAVLTPEQAAILPEWDFAKNPPKRPWDPRPEAKNRQ